MNRTEKSAVEKQRLFCQLWSIWGQAVFYGGGVSEVGWFLVLVQRLCLWAWVQELDAAWEAVRLGACAWDGRLDGWCLPARLMERWGIGWTDRMAGRGERGALACLLLSGVFSVSQVKFPSCCQHTTNNEDMQRHTHTFKNDIWNALLAFIRLLHTLHQNRLLITAENNYWNRC